MASITSASLLSEAEFGCEHLAAILTQSGNTAEQFKSSFLKTHNALAPRPLPLFPKPLTVDDLPKQKGGLRTASLLRPKPAHTKETGHQFYMESRGRILFCQDCGDFVYDHDLERLRSLPYGMHQGCAVAEAFADFNSSDKAEGFAALNLLLASWRASPTLAGYHQQDAHEYYQFLVDKLHTSTEGHVDDHDQGCSCFFHQTFYGKLKSSVMCDNCGNITKTEDPMLDLSLDVQVQAKKRAMGGGVGPSATPTLNGCLESFTSPERLMAGVYNCSECGGTPQKATKRLRIKKLPAILCMQLKRFEHSSAVSEKVEGRVDFPLSINMLPYTTHRHREDLDKSKFVYDLSSAVVHKGKLDAGHYYVYCKQGDQWVLFNDDQVTAATEAEVLNADAYLLFYNLRLFTAPLQ
ncbi:hypothetical protein ACP6JC_002600 [Aspergillus fumigatus]